MRLPWYGFVTNALGGAVHVEGEWILGERARPEQRVGGVEQSATANGEHLRGVTRYV